MTTTNKLGTTGKPAAPPKSVAPSKPLAPNAPAAASPQTAKAATASKQQVPRAGEPAPWFISRTSTAKRFTFDTVAGRYIVMLFLGSSASPVAKAALDVIARNAKLFDDRRASLFGVTVDAEDEAKARLKDNIPGIRYFYDTDLAVSRLYGATPGRNANGDVPFTAYWLLLDPSLRVMATMPLEKGDAMMQLVARLPAPDRHAGPELWAPVLVLPRILEPAFCRRLIDLYAAQGGTDSGFMREINGRTMLVVDHVHKRRSDFVIQDEKLIAEARGRIHLRAIPEIKKAFQFEATRIERFIVACYDGLSGGHFNPHRDNTTSGTAHRRFAMTINLDAEAYEGGDLRFPEFGSRTYRAPTGGAVVFSCSLLHEATPVTKGTRYAFLPFLYDESGAKLREKNAGLVDERIGRYSAKP